MPSAWHARSPSFWRSISRAFFNHDGKNFLAGYPGISPTQKTCRPLFFRVIFPHMKKWLSLLIITSTLSAGVEDRANFFTATEIASANQHLENLKAQTGKEILILTIEDLSGKTISQAARQEASARKLNGIIVLISRNPRKLEVMAGAKTALVFTKAHRDELLKIFQRDLAKAPDTALKNSVAYVESVIRNAPVPGVGSKNIESPASGESHALPGGLKWIFVIGFILLITRLISYLVSQRADGNSGPAVGSSAAFSGGGFWSSLMGGVIGAVAGNWLYDKLSSGPPSHYSDAQDRFSAEDSWRGDDSGEFHSGSGGDWGSDDGGFDSGGSEW